jgi:hypothetical protein
LHDGNPRSPAVSHPLPGQSKNFDPLRPIGKATLEKKENTLKATIQIFDKQFIEKELDAFLWYPALGGNIGDTQQEPDVRILRNVTNLSLALDDKGNADKRIAPINPIIPI